MYSHILNQNFLETQNSKQNHPEHEHNLEDISENTTIFCKAILFGRVGVFQTLFYSLWKRMRQFSFQCYRFAVERST